MSDPEEEDDLFQIYDELFKPLEEKYGRLDDVVLSSADLFGMSFVMRKLDGMYVTYSPYHLVETHSREGLKYALFVVSATSPQESLTSLLTGLANWFLENEFGDGDTADISGFEIEGLPSNSVRFKLFSQHPDGHGLYEVQFTGDGD
ncbi:MAG: hypothetical protein AAGH68_07365 [Pseudomonadota bacterium]